MSERGAEGILKAKGLIKSETQDPIGAPETPPADSGGGKKPRKRRTSGSAGGSTVRGTARPTVTDEDIRPKLAAAKAADTDDDTEKPSKAGEAVGRAIGKPVGAGLSLGNQGAGFVLGLLVWGWVVRPYLTGGLPGMKAVLMAKFFNKDASGKELP